MQKYNYSKLRGKIIECFSSQLEFAKKLGISATSLNYKLNNKSPFSQEEIMKCIEIFNLNAKETIDYFFTLKVEKKSTN